MVKLTLFITVGDYDWTRPLIDDSVQIHGVGVPALSVGRSDRD